MIGPWSDTFHTPLGRRKPFMLAAIGPLAFCLALMAFMPSLWTTTLIVLAFFFAYYVYEPPYRGLYPDLLDEAVYGRAQGAQHLMRGLALGTAVLGGARLFHFWHPAPFLLAAVVVSAACAAPVAFVTRPGATSACSRASAPTCATPGTSSRANPDVRRFLIANAAWEGTFAGARSFVLLYITVGLGAPTSSRTRCSARSRPAT